MSGARVKSAQPATRTSRRSCRLGRIGDRRPFPRRSTSLAWMRLLPTRFTFGTSIRHTSERGTARSAFIGGKVKSVSVWLMAAPFALSRDRSNPRIRVSSRSWLAAVRCSREIGRLDRVALFHRLEGSSNLNSRDENNEAESLPDQFG